jgi:serine/threonine protein kinase
VGGGCAASPLSELQVKIIDLGLAAPAPDESVGGWLTAETGTYRWMAPEVRKQ